jgi:transcriptional regulator of acetoin/glycerol metabolism
MPLESWRGWGVHRIGALLSGDEALWRQGRVELAEVLERAGGVEPAARELGVPARTVWRWIERAQLIPPDGRSPVDEREVREALKRSGGNVSAAARELGMSREGLRKRLKRSGVIPRK